MMEVLETLEREWDVISFRPEKLLMFLLSLQRFWNNLIVPPSPGSVHRAAPEVSAGLGFFESTEQQGKVQVSSLHAPGGVKLDGEFVSTLSK